MNIALALLFVLVVCYVVIVLGRRNAWKSERRRKRELEEIAETLYKNLSPLEALDRLFVQTAQQMYRDRQRGSYREDLQRDCTLIHEMRLSIIEFNVLESIDRPGYNPQLTRWRKNPRHSITPSLQ